MDTPPFAPDIITEGGIRYGQLSAGGEFLENDYLGITGGQLFRYFLLDGPILDPGLAGTIEGADFFRHDLYSLLCQAGLFSSSQPGKTVFIVGIVGGY